MNILFEEKQRFTQWWVWAILFICTISPILLLYWQPEDMAFFSMDIPDAGSLSALVIMVLVVLLFALLQLRTTITRDKVSLVYFPFVRKTVNVSEITNIEVINYGFVGGWGIRLFTNYGTVYNVRGNKGLHIKLKNGKQLVIGTQKPESLKQAVEQLK